MGPRLEGQVAIVTGGGSGIGRAACEALAREGARVVVVGRRLEALEATVELLGESTARFGTRAIAMGLDVRSESDMELMAARVLESFGRIDILVASAGILRAEGMMLRPVSGLPTTAWDEVMRVNLRGLFLSNRAVLPTMIGQRGGEIVNISSISGKCGMAFDAAYSASKFGVIGLSESIAEEVATYGVRVQTLVPGPFATELLHRRWNTKELPQAVPPASRVADAIVRLVTFPGDVRLVTPTIEPLAGEASGGWQSNREKEGPGRGPAPSRAVEARRERPSSRTLEESAMTMQGMPAGRLAGKVIIVTGGTGGIGLATCRAAAREGACLVVADIDPARIDAAVAELRDLSPPGTGHLGVPVDVRDEAQVEAMARLTVETFGRIDALVASAGILRKRGTPPKPITKVTADEWDEVLDINLKGTFLTNRAVLATMTRQRSGTIINISSVSGLKGRAHDGPYCASKFGVIGLSQSIADEVKSLGIRVQPLMPDAVDTPIWEQNHPVPRPGDALPPERVADLIVFMLGQPEDTILASPVIAPLGARRRQIAGRSAASEGRPAAEPVA